MTQPILIIKNLNGLCDYTPIWRDMQQYTNERTPNSADELWFLEHHPVYTQGQNGKPEHVLNPKSIPVIQVDRGGQVTYHGPGQLVVYFLIDLRRLSFTVRQLVSSIEQAVIHCLADYGVCAAPRADAPGVYVNGDKIASLGLRIRRGCSYHGLSFNIDMDLEPFSRINPCGLQQLKMTQLSTLVGPTTCEAVKPILLGHIKKNLGYTRGY